MQSPGLVRLLAAPPPYNIISPGTGVIERAVGCGITSLGHETEKGTNGRALPLVDTTD